MKRQQAYRPRPENLENAARKRSVALGEVAWGTFSLGRKRSTETGPRQAIG